MLSETLLAYGSKVIHVPAGSRLTLLPQVSATLYQIINKPNHPQLNKYIIEIFAQEYITDITSAGIDYLVVAGNGFVNYQLDYAPPVNNTGIYSANDVEAAMLSLIDADIGSLCYKSDIKKLR